MFGSLRSGKSIKLKVNVKNPEAIIGDLGPEIEGPTEKEPPYKPEIEGPKKPEPSDPYEVEPKGPFNPKTWDP